MFKKFTYGEDGYSPHSGRIKNCDKINESGTVIMCRVMKIVIVRNMRYNVKRFASKYVG
jgi:hypothetical protein